MPRRLRAATRADLPAIYDLLDASFEAPRDLFVRQTECDSTFRFRQARVAEADGRVVAYVRIFARRMLVRGVPLLAGGLGSVATRAGARGLGHATALLADAIVAMRRQGMAVSFLFSGIPSFYEPLGWRIVREPQVETAAREAAALPDAGLYSVRRMRDADVPRLLAIYRRATAGTTGAVVRTARTWRDAQHWLEEDAGCCLVAERNGVPVAYLRSRQRAAAHQILEAEHLPNHDEAVGLLLAACAAQLHDSARPLAALSPDGHPLTLALQTLPSSRTTTDVEFPMLARVVSLRAALDALLPQLDRRAATHRGEPFTLELAAPESERVTLSVAPAGAAIADGPATHALDAAAALDVLFGQRRASALVRPPPAPAVARRLDALFPTTPLHFWNSDRI